MTFANYISLFSIALCTMLLIRNSWVFEKRLNLFISGDISEYMTYPQMMLRFWIWDIKKLKRDL